MGLFNSTVLDWIIGIVCVYLLLAIICTTINEWVAGITKVRAVTLAKAIHQLLDGQASKDPAVSFLQQFYAHPLITGMMKPDKTGKDAHPAYMQARQFATTVMDLSTPGHLGSISFSDLEGGVKNLPDGDVKKALLALIQNADGKLNVAQKNIEQWFNDTMDRASGWYKRRTQIVTIVVAAFLTITTNADTVRIGHILWTNGTVRSLMVETAKARSTNSAANAANSSEVTYPDKNKPLNPVRAVSKSELDNLHQLLGWSGENLTDPYAWASRLLGWFLTTAAISLGAPFWFDLLNKIMNVRNAGKKPDSSSDKGDDKPQAAQVTVTPVLPLAPLVPPHGDPAPARAEG
jgi:hypothetical protein